MVEKLYHARYWDEAMNLYEVVPTYHFIIKAENKREAEKIIRKRLGIKRLGDTETLDVQPISFTQQITVLS